METATSSLTATVFSKLLTVVSENVDWQIVGSLMGLDPQHCMDLWHCYQTNIAKLSKDNPAAILALVSAEEEHTQKRMRRKASQIKRLFQCPDKNCTKSYGTEGALKMHLKTKHPEIPYDPMNPPVIPAALAASVEATTRKTAAVNPSQSSDESSCTSPRDDSSSSAPASPNPFVIATPTSATAVAPLATPEMSVVIASPPPQQVMKPVMAATLLPPASLPMNAPFYMLPTPIMSGPNYFAHPGFQAQTFLPNTWIQHPTNLVSVQYQAPPTSPAPSPVETLRPGAKRSADLTTSLETSSAAKRSKVAELAEESSLASALCSLQSFQMPQMAL